MAYFIKFKTNSDSRGHLTVIEKEIPFDIKRVYYIYGVAPGSIRGQHRHHRTVHALVCLKGSCDLYINDGKKKERITLSGPDQGLILPPEDWHSMYNFSEDAI